MINDKPAGPAPDPMPKWEYYRVSMTPQTIADPHVFNALGAAGWQLVCFDLTGSAWFKRRLA